MKLGVMASHNGSTLQAVLDACAKGEIEASVALVISNNGGSKALARARQANVATRHLSSVTHPEPTSLDEAIRDEFRDAGCDWVLLAGYMKRLGPATLAAFTGRLINVHPSLLPKHGGQGMFGVAVHEAVLAAGDPVTGATVHEVSGDYDRGRIIGQLEVAVSRTDTPETLQTRVQAAERKLLIATLAELSRATHADGQTKKRADG